MIVEMFNQIIVDDPTFEDAVKFPWVPSILGLDFLSRYKIVLQYIMLEK
jgi:hypothetical protein